VNQSLVSVHYSPPPLLFSYVASFLICYCYLDHSFHLANFSVFRTLFGMLYLHLILNLCAYDLILLFINFSHYYAIYVVTYQGGIRELKQCGFGLTLGFFAIDYNHTDYKHWEQLSTGSSLNPFSFIQHTMELTHLTLNWNGN
jgi:hypothetical protein